ncbi:hypothetical protein LguiA_015015 [Lonicera macranthoides]
MNVTTSIRSTHTSNTSSSTTQQNSVRGRAQSCKISQINLSTTSASKIYFNLDIPEVTEFMQMYDGNVNRKINAASEPIKHMTIVEILSLHSDSDSEKQVKNEAEGPQKTIEDVESPTKAAEQAGMSSTSKRKESSPIKPLHNKKMKKTNLRM